MSKVGLSTVLLGAIILLAVGVRFYNLSSLGYVNHYYTAAVKSMLQSWHNFFFAAAEPGGSVTVDKPPLGLWFQVASAAIFGVNGFAVLLPQLVAGILSVVVLYVLIRRWFGVPAGLLAALALAVSPVAVATDRNNTIDSTLVLTLLLATWAFVRATEKHGRRFVLLGALLVGIGFNIKMLEAFLPLPAFYAMYFLGSPERIWRKVANLAMATVLLVAVSLSWALAVDLTPADQRPYVGSSSNNTVTELIIGYNGLMRLVGRQGLVGPQGLFGNSRSGSTSGAQQFGGDDGRTRDGAPQFAAPQDGAAQQSGAPQDGANLPRWQGQPPDGGADGGTRVRPQRPSSGTAPFGGANRGGFNGGGMSTGQPGPFRLLIAPLDNEAGWLLPLALFSIVLLAVASRWRWPLTPKHRAMVLWGGWLITTAIFFSVAGFFHEYYLTTMAAPIAAMTAIGISELWHLREHQPWVRAVLLLAAAGGVLALQIRIAKEYDTAVWWWIPVAVAALGGVWLLASTLISRLRRTTFIGFGAVALALFVIPGIWSGLTAAGSSSNQSLPAAYAGTGSHGPADQGDLQINQQLLSFLEANTQDTEYLMAVPSSMQGADYVIATGRPVLYIGGFMGQDPVVDGDGLAQLVADGDLRYIYWDARGGGFNRSSDVSSWVATECTQVQGYQTNTQNSGAPDGTQGSAARSTGFGAMQVELYDCSSAGG